MRRKRAMLAMVLALSLSSAGGAEGLKVQKGKRFPSFELSEISPSQGLLRSYNLEGKVLVLIFFTKDVPACARQLPVLVRLFKKYRDKGVAVVGLSEDEKTPEILGYLKENGVEFPVVRDVATALSGGHSQYQIDGLTALPSTFVLDKKGVLKFVHVGVVSRQKLEREIKLLL